MKLLNLWCGLLAAAAITVGAEELPFKADNVSAKGSGRFAVNGQERAASQTLQNGKNQLKKISSYAAFSTEEATQPSVMMIIPDLTLLDFTVGAAIRAGGCRRGYGWFPGANVRHSDFAENDLDRNAEVFMDVILAAVSPEKTFSETSRAAMDFYKSFKTAGK